MQKLLIRDAVEADSTAVAVLLGSDPEVEPIERARLAAVWRWLYFENPHRAHKVLVGEDEHGAIVGHAALLPFAYRINGEQRIGGFQCQLFVREDVRRSGLFLRLVKKILAEHRSAGFDFVYSLVTRPAVLEGYLALGFKPIGKVPVMARPIHLLPIMEKLVGRSSLLRPLAALPLRIVDATLSWLVPRQTDRVEVTQVSRLQPAEVAAINQTYEGLGCVALRSTDILKWRFEASPRPEYRIFVAKQAGRPVGGMVIRSMLMKGLSTLTVVDLTCDEHSAALALLGQALRLARAEGAALLATLLPPHSQFRRAFRRTGFIRTPESFTLVVYKDKSGAPSFVPNRFEDWHLSFFEHDFV